MASAKSGAGTVALLVGTRKGAFIATSSEGRVDWSISDIHIPGADVFHLAYDARDGTLYAAANSVVFGPDIQKSRDLGATWEQCRSQPRFPSDADLSVSRVWHLLPGRTSEPGVVYVGVEPAALFRSDDDGDSWVDVPALTSHPTRDRWHPGAGGLMLHSIVLDHHRPERMWVGISAAGVFRTDDAGESWAPANRNVRADFLPDRFPELGQCPHKLLGGADGGGVLYQQNHCGVYRSDDGADSWEDVSEGLPSRWSLPLALHPRDPDTLYVVPEDRALDDEVGGGYRYVTDGLFRVFRSRNGGRSWESSSKGLPDRKVYLHCMREAMTTDGFDPAGVYVGTTSGQVFYSRDEGDSWELLVDSLPPVNSIDAAMLV